MSILRSNPTCVVYYLKTLEYRFKFARCRHVRPCNVKKPLSFGAILGSKTQGLSSMKHLVAHQGSHIFDTAIGDDDDITGIEFGMQDRGVDIASTV